MGFFSDDYSPFEGIDIGTGFDPHEAGVYEIQPDDVVDDDHDFKITVVDVGATKTITVSAGKVMVHDLFDDSTSRAMAAGYPIDIDEKIEAGINDTTDDRGIWIKLDTTGIGTSGDSHNGNVGSLIMDPAVSGEIVVDATHKTSSQAGALTATTDGYSYVYVGQVTVIAGDVTIIQDLDESFTFLQPTYLSALVKSGDNMIDLDTRQLVAGLSSDTPNPLKHGADGKLTLLPSDLISSATPNYLTVDSGGDEKLQVDLSITEGTGITVTGTGDWTISLT